MTVKARKGKYRLIPLGWHMTAGQAERLRRKWMRDYPARLSRLGNRRAEPTMCSSCKGGESNAIQSIIQE